jgi:hypothetical protein
MQSGVSQNAFTNMMDQFMTGDAMARYSTIIAYVLDNELKGMGPRCRAMLRIHR